jgi:Ca-activated chloride channel family protein
LDQLEPAESDERGFRPITELFYWPLGAAAVLALAAALAAFAATRWQWSRGAVGLRSSDLRHG